MHPKDGIAEDRVRRVFRAKGKLNTPGLVSHVTQRAAGKEPLFLEDPDYLYMLVLLKEISQRYALKIYAFCLMGNHLHLLLSPQAGNLYDAMRDLFSRYAMWFNKKYERKGHLFAGPYRQAVCLDDGYLLAASLYVHLSPVKARAVAVPEEYRWSSVSVYCEEGAAPSFVDATFLLGILSERHAEARDVYRDLLHCTAKLEMAGVFEQEDIIERVRSALVSLFPPLFKRMARRNHAAKATGKNLLSMEALEDRIENLREGRVSRPETKPAKKYLIEQLIARGYKRGEIAQRLCISRKTVYNLLKTKK